jgi:hypothetical protein
MRAVAWSAAVPALACALALACAGPAWSGAAPAAGPRGPVATRVLLARLRATGRAEATLRVGRPDALGPGRVTIAGTLALEPPRSARLDFADGERLTLRADGGDWLQPATRQLVRAGAARAAGLLAWWAALLDPSGAGLVERKLGPRRYALAHPGAGADQVVELGADGLPRLIRVDAGGGEPVEYRVTRWRFVKARGHDAFVLRPPPGYEVVDLP